MSEIELNPDVFTADYTGEPGRRTFYLQARDESGAVTYLVEKDQVALLAAKLRELLIMIDASDTVGRAAPARDPALQLAEPAEPAWRVGTIGLGYEESEKVVIVVVEPVESEGDPAEELDRDETVRFLLRPDQARSFVLHASAVVGEGRPACRLCGLPIDPEGHNCPASNGHRPP